MDMSMVLGSFAGSTSTLGDSALAFSRTAAGILLTAIWQGALIACCLAICFKLAPRTTAALRFTIWAAGFIVVALLPFLPLLITNLLSPTHADATAGIATAARPWLRLDIRWSVALTAVWAVASLIRAGNLAADSLRLHKLWKTATSADVSIGHAAALTVPGRKPVEVCSTQELERPAVIGFLAPRILIPEWLMARLTSGELDQIVLHETEHLRRGDDWTNLLQKISLVIFPLNPVLIWIERRLCKEREMACDDGVVRVTRAPRAYAACLTGLAERGVDHRSEALSLGAWQRRPELVHRVHSILLRKPVLKPAAARGMAVLLGGSLVFGSVELARCPQLVAFVPPRETETAQVSAPAVENHVRPQMMNASYTPMNRGIYGSAPSAPHLTELKAVLPSRPISQQSATPTVHPLPAKNFSSQSLLQRASSTITELPAQPEETMADATGFDANPSREQHWVVLTTYEEIQTWDQGTAMVANDATKATNLQAAQSPSQDPNHATGRGMERITVTRLIFRTLPAGKVDPTNQSPTALVPIRGGWFFIQL